jgi:GT2 family glycosyltransferase
LDSLAQQNYPYLEVVVVDNASNDDTCDRVRHHYPRAKIIELKENSEYCRGNNVGIGHSQGAYVLVLNQDVQLASTFIAEMVQALEADPAIGIATGKLLRCAPDGVSIMPATIDNAGGHILLSNRAIRDRGYGEPDVGQYDSPEDVVSAYGAAAFCRRAALEAVRYKREYFDEAFVAYKEDFDLSRRCRALGWRVRFVPSATGYHVRGWAGAVRSISERTHLSRARRRHSFKNRYLLLIKHESVSSLVADLPSILWYEVRSLAFCVFLEPHLLLALLRVGTLLPEALQKRRHLRTLQKLQAVQQSQPASAMHRKPSEHVVVSVAGTNGVAAHQSQRDLSSAKRPPRLPRA